MSHGGQGIIGLDHVQIAIPSSGLVAAREYYGDFLGLPELPRPAEMAERPGLWFQCGPQQLHIGVEAAFAAQKKAHPAFMMATVRALEDLAVRVASNGGPVRWANDAPGWTRFHTDDPFGNRLEFTARST